VVIIIIRLGCYKQRFPVRFQVLTAASMVFRIVFWNMLPCKIIVDRRFRGTSQKTILMMEAVRTSETSVDNYFTRQYMAEDNSEQRFPVVPLDRLGS
jgi:hypothetical protein